MTGTPIIAWNVNDDYLDHMWLIKSVPDEPDTYTIRNTVGGSYMDLTGSTSRILYVWIMSVTDRGHCHVGLAKNETPIIGFHKMNPGENQKWIIKKETSGTGYWK